MQENYDQFQVGNWVIYRPERNYCTIKSLSPILKLAGALETYSGTIGCISKIEITEDKLQVIGFDVQHPISTKKFNNEINVVVVFSSSGVHKLYKNNEEFCELCFIHQVQNACYEITGVMIQGNLYGVREG